MLVRKSWGRGHWSYTVPGMSVGVLKMAEAVILYVMGSLQCLTKIPSSSCQNRNILKTKVDMLIT